MLDDLGDCYKINFILIQIKNYQWVMEKTSIHSKYDLCFKSFTFATKLHTSKSKILSVR